MIRYMIEKIHMSVKGNYAKGTIPHTVMFRVVLIQTVDYLEIIYCLNQQPVGT